MTKKIFLLLLLSMHTPTKPLIGELVLGAMGAAAMKAAISPTAKAARWAVVGYLLNTPAGKKFSAYGFSKMRAIVSSKMLGTAIGTGASVGLSSNMIQVSCSALKRYSQSSMQLFRSMPKSMAEFRARMSGLSFRNPFTTKVTEFHAHTASTAFESNSKAQVSLNSVKKGFARVFSYGKSYGQPQAEPSMSFTTANSYTVHQAQGLFPRINHYHGDQGRAKFWKGFASGSFVTWPAAWYVYNRESQKKVD